MSPFKRFVQGFQKIGLDKTSDRLEYHRVLMVNTLTLVTQGFIIILVAIVLGYGLWAHVGIGTAAFFLIKPTYYFNRIGKFRWAPLYLINFCVIAILAASYFAFYESRFSETENWLYAFIPFSVFLFDGRLMRIHFWMITLELMVTKFFKFYLLDLPMEQDFVLLQVNTIVLCLALFVFLLIFKYGLRRSLAKLEEADRMKNKMFSIVAHDLKSPFVLFEAMLQASREKLITKKQFEELQENIQEKFEPIKNTVTELLDWSQAQLKNSEPEIIEFNPSDILDKMKSSFRTMTESKNLQIKISGDVEKVRMDANHFAVIIRNLMHNAIKFSKENSEVIVNLHSNAEYNEITVEDHGVGMDQKVIDSILRNRLVSSTLGTAKERGTGIGLNLVKELTDRNHSKLVIISKEGLGSKFVIKVPK